MRLTALMTFVLMATMAIAQPKTAPKPATPAPKPAPKEVSDPKAKAILDKLKKQYDAYKSLEVSFTLSVEVAGQKADVQKGKLIQAGDKYAAEMDKQKVYCDGKTVWFYQKKNNEVQVSSLDPKGKSPVMGPKQLMSMYQSGQFLYSITGEGTENGKNVTYIEFKPTTKNSEYSKLRMAIDKTTQQFVSIKVFNRDASRYALTLNALTPNKTYAPATFTFDKTKFPGVKVEDLRID